mmetsp:Transcript_21139/g.55666  ORF Transcript_21139/g.55666 Transcript_21139/m.55666 type:complete len:253 (+) Transcript_21139:77-835(+)|eukprot:2930669-Prymnesium_polylepis.1
MALIVLLVHAPAPAFIAAVRAPAPRLAASEPSTGCKYGTKAYWDSMYAGVGAAAEDGLPADAFSWYCGWTEIEPFWEEFVPQRAARVLVPGMGNDATLPKMFDAGWRGLTAFDYCEDAVVRARALVGDRDIRLLCADATALPLPSAASGHGFDAVFDKGALDAIGIGGSDLLEAAVGELARTTVGGGVVVSVSRALEPGELDSAFCDEQWETLRDGALHIAPCGAASTDLSANLLVWRRRERNEEDGGEPAI